MTLPEVSGTKSAATHPKDNIEVAKIHGSQMPAFDIMWPTKYVPRKPPILPKAVRIPCMVDLILV